MKQKILKLNKSEYEWIKNNLTVLHELIASVVGEDNNEWLKPNHLDEAYKVWFANHNKDVEDPNPIINAFGIGFGQLLIDHLNLEWKVVQDNSGTEIAVYGKKGEILLFPPNLVAKRYVKGETDFFVYLYNEIKTTIEEIRNG